MKRRDEVLVGLFTTAAIVLLVMSMLWLTRGGLARGYPLYAKFEWGAGLKQGQPVLFSGVNVGFVDRLELLQDGGLVTTIRIYKSQRLPAGTRARIEANGLFGDMLVALRATAPNGRYLAAGDTILTEESGAQMGEVMSRVDSVGANLEKLTAALNREFVDEQGFAELREAMVGAQVVMRTLNRVVIEQSAMLTETQRSLQRVASSFDSTQIDATFRSLQGAAGSTAQLAEDLRATNARLGSILATLESGEGTASKLLNDPGLYDEVRSLVRRVDTLTAEFKANPRRFIKLSIF
jgi:phospholipid/cholesterol/gamma-HCH transport system substrate-binding protein